MASGRGCGRKERRGNKLHGHKAAMSRTTAEIKRVGLPEARCGARQVHGGEREILGALAVWASAAELTETTPVGDEDKSDQ